MRARAHVGRWARYVGIASGQRCSAMMHCIDFGGRGKFGIIHIIGLNHKRARAREQEHRGCTRARARI